MTVIEERTREVRRLKKVLKDAGVKLRSVPPAPSACPAAPRSTLVFGERDPVVSAELAKASLRRKTSELQQALLGSFHAHHTILVCEMLPRIDAADASGARLSAEITTRLERRATPDGGQA